MENAFICQLCHQQIPEEFISCPNNACIKVSIDEQQQIPKDSYWHDLYLP